VNDLSTFYKIIPIPIPEPFPFQRLTVGSVEDNDAIFESVIQPLTNACVDALVSPAISAADENIGFA
jgi:hypothetical protein